MFSWKYFTPCSPGQASHITTELGPILAIGIRKWRKALSGPQVLFITSCCCERFQCNPHFWRSNETKEIPIPCHVVWRFHLQFLPVWLMFTAKVQSCSSSGWILVLPVIGQNSTYSVNLTAVAPWLPAGWPVTASVSEGLLLLLVKPTVLASSHCDLFPSVFAVDATELHWC